MWTEDEGVLSFEWVLIITVIVIGVVGGLAAARDGITDELGDAAEAMLALDQSYRVDFPLLVGVNCETDDSDIESQSSDSAFRDEANFEDCERLEFGFGQGLENDGISGDP
jgi:hypothetical protein